MGGVAVDICLTWATDCGKPAADAYCRAAGYAVATTCTPRPRAQQTYVIGSGQVCNGDFCTSFASVTICLQKGPLAVPEADSASRHWARL